MDETLRQLGGILLGSVPTIILLVLLYIFYRLLVHNPLAKVLFERRAQTTGAVETAKAQVAAAEQRTAEYESRLRDARSSIYKAQEAKRKQILEQRMAAVAEAKAVAEARVQSARAELKRETETAKSSLQADVAALAAQIVRSILRPGSGSSLAGGSR